jgi:acylphosphatase
VTQRRVQLLIVGTVQGVAYRWSAQRRARELGLTGWVRNLPGGEVEALAEGATESVAHFIEWCRRGPPAAEVARVDVTEHPPTGEYRAFDVRH